MSVQKTENTTLSQQALSRLNIAAVAYACVLSVACLARGAVHDVTVAAALLASMPILLLAFLGTRAVHTKLKIMGCTLLACMGIVLFLQQWFPPVGDDLWQQTAHVTGLQVRPAVLYDKAAWLQGMGRLLLIAGAFVIALCIGSSESSARLFLQALLASGAACVAITFFIKTSNGVPSSSFYSYTHGFVNPNNAATYLGVLLLLALAQARRVFRYSSKSAHKKLPEFIDRLNIAAMMKGFFVLFAILLSFAGLFMTGSRGGIFLSVICSVIFLTVMVQKASLKSGTRQSILIGSGLFMAALMAWSFSNYGQIFVNKLQREGLSNNTRSEIFAAVIPMIQDHPLLGAGLGSFPGVFQQYRPQAVSSDGIIDKAHNTYLEFAAEMGMPLFLVLLAVVMLVGRMLYVGVQQREERYVTPALGLVVWLLGVVHSLVDFPLQVPGIAALFVAVLTVCVSQTDPRFSQPLPSPASKTPVKRVRTRKRRSSSTSE